MNELPDYVALNCFRELQDVKNSRIADVNSPLSLEERVLIYKYTQDGYESLNAGLRISKGKDFSDFGKLLDKTINKLPDYVDLVYRAVDLTDDELQKYIVAKEKSSILVEHTFISSSRSKAIAYQFGKSCQFRIYSKSGKNIEEFAKYGLNNAQNEKEILFRPNLKFEVLEITKKDKKTLITLEEVSRK